jgi:hypothetical protein
MTSSTTQKECSPLSPPDSIYYEQSRCIRLLSGVSLRARMAVYRLFMEVTCPSSKSSILDVGVSLDTSPAEANVLEQLYPYRNRLTCAGIGDGAVFRQAYPGVTFVKITPHTRLPFPDKQFDIGYSNAVLEHTGSRLDQRAFVSELCRVAKRVFIVVPNRLFPIEHHTGIPLIHYLPMRLFRSCLRKTRYRYWAEERHLNPLFPRDLRRLFDGVADPQICYAGFGVSVFKSNLVAIL